MNYWLVKSEPSVYSWETFEQEKQTSWDGVRNNAARLHLKNMRKNDLVFFYHSNEGLCIVGLAKVSIEAYPDPTSQDPKWVSVELTFKKKLKSAVKLNDIKEDVRLKNMALVRIGRLSVQPVIAEEARIILDMSGTKI